MQKDLKVQIYADGADIDSMLALYEGGIIKGFTTNPTLMKKAGILNYKMFALQVLEAITDLPISFEVFSDDFNDMEKEAREIAGWGKNLFVKIPITNTKGQPSYDLIKTLSADGIPLNITAILTLNQVEQTLQVFTPGMSNIVSVFAGRIADTGVDPEPIMKEASAMCKQVEGALSLWASCRELYNIFMADRCGCDIITVTHDILAKLPMVGRDLTKLSLETVNMFYDDGKSLGFRII